MTPTITAHDGTRRRVLRCGKVNNEESETEIADVARRLGVFPEQQAEAQLEAEKAHR